jgi:ubiquinone/menaquinone biosynthesis C-methylase UbiE
MARRNGHRWFAAFWEWLVRHEPAQTTALRRRIISGSSGRILEIGCGTGANFPHYPQGTEVAAIEPDPYMLPRARERANAAAASIEVHQAPAENIPFPDASFDTVVASLVLCSVDEPPRALAEIRRVLKPGARLIFLEHVRYPGGAGAAAQNIIAPLWRWMGAGCRLNQDTERIIKDSGFSVTELERIKLGPFIDPSRPVIIGTAERD